MAKRLIDAMTLVTKISKRVMPLLSGRSPQDVYNAILECIAEAPTEDAAPVTPGKWEHREFGMAYQCSRCGHVELYILSRFCPDCGAEMDKEGTVND